MKLKLKDIRLDGGTQPREFINQTVVDEYAEEMVESDNFPPMVVFNDGANFWLADGFHRWHANKKAGFVEVECDVRQGTKRDAVLFSVGANAVHGLRRTNEDKRKAILTLLNDIEWGEWSDSEIARQCCVSHVTVGRVRKTAGLAKTEQKYVNKHGQEAKMKKPQPVEVLKTPEVMVQDDKLAELAAAHEELADENAKLMDQLQAKNYDATEEEKVAILSTVEELRAYIKQLEAELKTVKMSRDDYQNKVSELLRQVDYWKKQANKAA